MNKKVVLITGGAKGIGKKLVQDFAKNGYNVSFCYNTSKIAAENLLNTIRKSKTKIQNQIKAKEERVNKLLELLEKDPEMKKRMDDILLNNNE